MATSKILTQEQMDASLRESQAALERARRVLADSRARRAKDGVTPEKLQRTIEQMSPRARTWINSLVSAAMAKAMDTKSSSARAPRKSRSMV
ncbi:MAG TPA: hypothetical protein VK624_21035 [Steroidobacteraceae bacterium]|jgi:hypothetical protein|nr:hypothetical protein [Steroidobacteraceae bacterium]